MAEQKKMRLVHIERNEGHAAEQEVGLTSLKLFEMTSFLDPNPAAMLLLLLLLLLCYGSFSVVDPVSVAGLKEVKVQPATTCALNKSWRCTMWSPDASIYI